MVKTKYADTSVADLLNLSTSKDEPIVASSVNQPVTSTKKTTVNPNSGVTHLIGTEGLSSMPVGLSDRVQLCPHFGEYLVL